MKTILLILPILALASCAGVEGYNPGEMNRAFRSMNEMNYNTRVFQLTGGRYYPGL